MRALSPNTLVAGRDLFFSLDPNERAAGGNTLLLASSPGTVVGVRDIFFCLAPDEAMLLLTTGGVVLVLDPGNDGQAASVITAAGGVTHCLINPQSQAPVFGLGTNLAD